MSFWKKRMFRRLPNWKRAIAMLGCSGLILAALTVYFGPSTGVSPYINTIGVSRSSGLQFHKAEEGDRVLEQPDYDTINGGMDSPSVKEEVVDDRSDITAHSKTGTPLQPQEIKVQVFPDWPQSDPKDSRFLMRVYIYSAFLAPHPPPPPPLNSSSPTSSSKDSSKEASWVHVVGFQEGQVLMPLKCCVVKPGRQLQPVEEPRVQLEFSKVPINQSDSPVRKRDKQVGVVYRCQFSYSHRNLRESFITLTSTSCPKEISHYLRIQEPEMPEPGSIGLCGKVLFGQQLDPVWLVEWFELQRLLGVTRVLLFDLEHPEGVGKVLRHYEKSGLLSVLPYKLPDRPWGRNIRRGANHDNYGDEQVMTTWVCRLLLANYDYVLALDLDEVVVPRDFFYLKPFFQDMFRRREDFAAIYFRVQFFVEEWGPVNKSSPLHVLQYLNSTEPWEARYKYVYIPAKTRQALTHQMVPFPGYTSRRAQPWEGALFHYRKCPFASCDMARITDKTLTHYGKLLEPRVSAAWKNVGLP